jgi:hypothetical protein
MRRLRVASEVYRLENPQFAWGTSHPANDPASGLTLAASDAHTRVTAMDHWHQKHQRSG